MKIRAISIYQPWASLIAVGAKKFETRTWGTSYRGPLLICAARWGQRPGYNRITLIWLLKQPEFFNALIVKYGGRGEERPLLDLWVQSIYQNLPFGKAVVIADLVDCEQIKEGFFNDFMPGLFGNVTSGRYAWRLENVRAIEPFPVKGRQGIFEVEIDSCLLEPAGESRTEATDI